MYAEVNNTSYRKGEYMIIEQLSILNFKNIAQADLHFSTKINCLFGYNGVGKTNLLDALYYLSFCKSHAHLTDSQLIRHGQDFCLLQGFYRFDEELEEIYCGIKRDQRKIFKKNKKEYDRLSEHIGLLPLVMVSPEDTELIQGGSENRRKFADMVISQYDKTYLQALIGYNKALLQRNSLLKNGISDPALYDVWEEQMVMTGSLIRDKRLQFTTDFLPVFNEYHAIICSGNERVSMHYQSSWNDGNPAELLAQSRSRDQLLGYSGSGIHRDDFDFRIGDHLIRKIGSQGQNKTFLIALKLAQFSFLVQTGASTPILLLDDIFDKLDTHRMEQIIHLVAQPQFGQIFITDTNRTHLDEIILSTGNDHRLFEVKNGEFI